MEKDIVQYSIDVRDPVDGEAIIKALEKAKIEVLGIGYKARWTHEDYWSDKPPYDSD